MKISKRFPQLFLVLSFVVFSTEARGQAAGINQTGHSGMFNGNSYTGGSYDPYTANATRTVTDITSAGGGGAYPLQWARTMNSRTISDTANGFGAGGGWSHNYDWAILPSEDFTTKDAGAPGAYFVQFPDGRFFSFSFASTDPYFRGPPGVKERFQPLNLTTKLAYLILPDGGKVEFAATNSYQVVGSNPIEYSSHWNYQATALIDPYGLRTEFSYVSGKLDRITEPAKRWLEISYDGNRISRVDAGHGVSIITQ
nr:hypothetical protein [Longispora sp. (in: high G+C Gram-positive bacteria)]